MECRNYDLASVSLSIAWGTDQNYVLSDVLMGRNLCSTVEIISWNSRTEDLQLMDVALAALHQDYSLILQKLDSFQEFVVPVLNEDVLQQQTYQ